MSDRKKVIVSSIGILSVVSLVVATVAISLLYGAAFNQERGRLIDVVKGQARIIESIARFDGERLAAGSQNPQSGAIAQIRDAYSRHVTFGGTGEVTLARREGDSMVFLLRHLGPNIDTPDPISFSSHAAEPMRRALLGKSGWVVAPDYRGVKVLAAYEPLEELGLGIVAKTDLSEVREPFVRAAIHLTALALLLVLGGSLLYFFTASPMIRRIEESETRYRSLVELSPDFIGVHTDGRFVFVNPAGARLLGAPSSEGFVGTRVLDIIPPEYHEQSKKRIREVLEEKLQTPLVELPIIKADGERTEVEATGTYIDYLGVPSVLLVMRDITQRKRAEKALRESEERFRAAQELSMDAFTILGAMRDEGGTIIDFCWQYVNPEAGRILDLAPQELVGRRLLDLLPGNRTNSDLFDRYLRVVEMGEPHDYELYYESEGIRGWFRNMAVKLGDGIAVSFSDITERKRMEDELRRSRDELELRVQERTTELEGAKEELQEQKVLLETILEQAADAILVTDKSGRPLFVNEAAKRMTLRDWEDHPFELYESYWGRAHSPDGRPVPVEEWFIPKALQGKVTAPREARMVRPDGSHYDILISAAPLRKPDGAIIGAVSIFSDITERKQAEEALRRSEMELRRLSSKLLEVQEVERKRIANEIHDSVGQSLHAIRVGLQDMLSQADGFHFDAARISDLLLSVEFGIEEVKNIYMGLRPSLLDDLGIIATVSWYLREFRKTYPSLHLEEDIAVGEERVDETIKIILFRVLQGALDNMARHSGASRARVSLREVEGRLELAVKDNGAGFEPGKFGMEDGQTQGIGLASMQERVESSGGVFTLKTSRGEGTTVRAVWDLSRLQ